MAVRKKPGFKYIPDKCNPPVDMGSAVIFADAIPGVNSTSVRPYGWTEYESAYRHQYIPVTKPSQKPCTNTCRPKGVARKAQPRQYVNPQGKYPRSTICQLCMQAKCCCGNIPPPWEERREKVVVYDPDSVRTLLVHGEVTREHPFVLSNDDYYRMMGQAIKKSKEEKEKECIDALRKKQMAIEECRERAEEMRIMDANRLNDSLSPQAREDMEEVLCRAEKILKADEPEVRTVNKVILGAKVQAIREAQLHEKDLIKCEQREEERRLNALMIQEAAHAFIKDEDKELEMLERKKRNLLDSLKAQLDEHEAMRFFMKEVKDKEAEDIKALWEKYDMEEIQKKHLEHENKLKLGKELIENQMQVVERMRRDKEIDRELDNKMVEFWKEKAAEEERLEKERLAQKKLKEQAVKLVLDTQKRTQDAKALRDELRARRHQEMQEREWRRKEKESAEKRRQATLDLKKGILDQIQSKQEWLIEQATFDKALFDKIYNIQDTRMQEELQKIEERKIKNAQYRYDLREQIHQFQLDKIKERKQFYIEGIKQRQEMDRRDRELRCFMQRKLEELRDSNMPEKYLKYIERAVEEELTPEWQKKMSKM